MAKMEKSLCKRDYYHIGWGRYRRFRSLDWSWGSGLHCSGWDQVGLICYQPCVDQFGWNWHGVAERCYPGCRGGYSNGRIAECHERCGEGQGLPQVPKECDGWIYCADGVGTCNARAVSIAFEFASFAANFAGPAAKTIKAARIAHKAGKSVAKVVMKQIKKLAKKLLKKAKKKLRKYMKKEAKEIRKDEQDRILQGGAEEFAVSSLESLLPSDVKAKVLEVADAVDPTGISSIVNAFHATSCTDIKMEPMPEADFAPEVVQVGADYYFVHDGHCAGGWINANTRQSDATSCATQCRNRPGCGYFAFNDEKPEGTNCALYKKVGGCPDDNRYPEYNSYRMMEDYQFFHDGHCAGGWINANTRQSDVTSCATQCRNRPGCGYFAFSSERPGTNCALYSKAGGCPDDNRYPDYNAFRMI